VYATSRKCREATSDGADGVVVQVREQNPSIWNNHPALRATPPGQAVLSKLASLKAESWRKYSEYSLVFEI
jgi:hypothetical protein